uniref:Uncharacterized protein n=1 Tax=Arundo donax TaxID=35708 RepID=A0A0A9ALB1_ARUDO
MCHQTRARDSHSNDVLQHVSNKLAIV